MFATLLALALASVPQCPVQTTCVGTPMPLERETLLNQSFGSTTVRAGDEPLTLIVQVAPPLPAEKTLTDLPQYQLPKPSSDPTAPPSKTCAFRVPAHTTVTVPCTPLPSIAQSASKPSESDRRWQALLTLIPWALRPESDLNTASP